MSKPVVGFIGLGVMGEPMCRNLRVRGGYRVVATDLDQAPLRRLAKHGVEAAAGVGAAVQAGDIVFASLPSGRVLEGVLRAPDGVLANLRAGQVFVDLGTSPVALTRKLAAELEARGARYLDAPVARTRQAAEAGTLSVMVGGDSATFDEVQPILACIASDITHCGAIGSGQVTKILNNMVLFETVAALSEACAIARRSGLDPALMFDTLAKGSADSFALRNHGMKAILPQSFPERAFSVEYARKDLAYALELAADTGVDAEGARRVDRLFARAIAAGLGEHYHPVISRIVDGE
jgi:3-hydroxyisobutyrate dehydrogenase-like beta-hydroxyacid dehydrogenase